MKNRRQFIKSSVAVIPATLLTSLVATNGYAAGASTSSSQPCSPHVFGPWIPKPDGGSKGTCSKCGFVDHNNIAM